MDAHAWKPLLRGWIMAVSLVLIGWLGGRAGDEARGVLLQTRISSLRSAIELYRQQHDGTCPRIEDSGLPQLCNCTDARGRVGAGGANYPYGPYCAGGLPANAFDGSTKVTAVERPGRAPRAAVGLVGGWQYDETTGNICPNHAGYREDKSRPNQPGDWGE